MGTYISVREAARLVGVSPSTLKRMSDEDLLPCVRTPGGHRRFCQTALELAASRHLGGCISNQSPQVPHKSIDDLISQLTSGDMEAIWEHVRIRSGAYTELFMRLEHELAPAMWRIGELWRRNEIDIASERLASSTMHRILDRLINQLDSTDNNPSTELPLAIIGTMEGNFDEISAKMVEVCFRIMPAKTLNLGCDLSTLDLVGAALALQPNWICISHTHVEDVQRAAQWHTELRERVPPETRIVIGGGGLSPQIRNRLKFDVYYESLRDAYLNERPRVM